MKKSYIKLIVFDVILLILLLLNSFILSILKNYTNVVIFLLLLLVIFKFLFGFEKDKHRYARDIILGFIIIYLSFFIIYYVLGIFIGFVRTTNYYSLSGIVNFLLPYFLIIVLKEFLRYQVVMKSENSKLLVGMSCLVFILLDISYTLNVYNLSSAYDVFIYIALYLLPIIGSNIVCTYICKKSGYKPNVFWLVITNMYMAFLPFVPNVGLYIESLIRLLFPWIVFYSVYSFYKKREHNIILSYEKEYEFILLIVSSIVVIVFAYFISGLFKFQAIAVASGSMMPNISKGDVVIIDRNYDVDDLKVGQVIAYKYDDIIVVHRLVDIKNIDGKYYLYSRGDANNDNDNYVIYEDMFMGTVNLRIPWIGLPTVWLSEL